MTSTRTQQTSRQATGSAAPSGSQTINPDAVRQATPDVLGGLVSPEAEAKATLKALNETVKAIREAFTANVRHAAVLRDKSKAEAYAAFLGTTEAPGHKDSKRLNKEVATAAKEYTAKVKDLKTARDEAIAKAYAAV
jgi:hypothetical protein